MALTVAAVATAEVTRIVRFVNIPLGLLLVIAAFLFARDVPVVFCSEVISALLLIVLSIPKGKIVERYGTWDKYVR
jgi:hypothetical protein